MRSFVVLSVLLGAGTFGSGCVATAEGAPGVWRRVVLVELFTSQGCSSCPPADAFVRALPSLGYGRDKVVPLTYHVDYWDRLGWKDPFADSDLTKRQTWYARSERLRSPDGQDGISGLYTPQMIVGGRVHLSGARRDDALREMARAAERAPRFDLEAAATIRGSTVDLAVRARDRAGQAHDGAWRVVVALAARSARTAVLHGENAGETLEEAAVVRALSPPIPLPPEAHATTSLQVTKPQELPWSAVDVVVFIQSETTLEVAAVLLLDPKQLRSPWRY